MEFVNQDYSQFESKTEAELESLAIEDSKTGYDAMFYLGLLQYEGCKPEQVAKNEKKGFNWIKEAAEKGQLDAQEYFTFHEIQSIKQTNPKKIQQYLENVSSYGQSI